MTNLVTPSQTIGPFFSHALVPAADNRMPALLDSRIRLPGETVTLSGVILDGAGEPVHDALVEIWQMAAGVGAWARSDTRTGVFTFEAIKPVASPACAPAINMVIFMRGLLHHVHTRAYFDDEVEANAGDEFLCSVPPAQRNRLIARTVGTASYEISLRMQGVDATPFVDI